MTKKPPKRPTRAEVRATRPPPKNPAAPGPKGITEAEIIELLHKKAGIVSLVAEELKIDRSGLHHRIANSPVLKAAMENVEETMLDAAEGVIRKNILKGDKDLSWKYMTTKGRRRGYSTSEIHVTLDSGTINALVAALGGRDVDTLRALRDAIASEPGQK